MAEASQEQNRSEEATPFKLRQARDKGSVARSMDLGFFAGLLAFGGFATIAGAAMIAHLSQIMRRALTLGIESSSDPQQAIGAIGTSYWPALQPVILFGATIMALVALLEIVQLRGIVFSAHPLKPDFTRINPGKGLKRLFSMRLLKEALKSVVKMAVYTVAATMLVRAAITGDGLAIGDASSLADTLRTAGMRLLWVFVLLALLFAAVDQVLARREFGKQMRMSRREIARESREREGDPRLRSKRKRLHAEFARRSASLGSLPGSDMLIVNPEHVAVALVYDRARSNAPVVRAKARDLHALIMKRRARQLAIPVFESPALARALYAGCAEGAEIGSDHYHPVAEFYFRLGETDTGRGPR